MMVDAVIIGAGPAGSVAALALARQGRRVALIEKAEFPRRKVCGEFISGSNLGMLLELGILDAIRAEAGAPVRRVALFAGDAQIAARMPTADGAYGFGLGRDRLDTLLAEAARQAGAEVVQPATVNSAERVGAGHRLVITSRDGDREIEANVVVAAHGSWAPGPLPTHLARTNRPSDLFGFKAHFHDAALPADLMPLLLFPGGYGGMVTVDRGRVSISCCIRRDVLDDLRAVEPGASASQVVERHLTRHCRGVADALASARLAGPWLAAGPIRPGIRSRYAGDIFRAGNLAGESHPIIAEGITMAMQSGWLLARALDDEPVWDRAGRERAGDTYARLWRRQFATRIRAASALSAVASLPGARQIMTQLVSAWPATLTAGAALSGKTRTVPGRPAATLVSDPSP